MKNIFKMSKTLDYVEYTKYAIVFAARHMWPVVRFNQQDDLKKVASYLKYNESIFNNLKTFDEIILFLDNANIHNFGSLAKYDKALAMVIYKYLMPDKVFIHVGPEKALKYLLGDKYKALVKNLPKSKIKYIDVCNLLNEFDILRNEPYLIEHCLCYIYSNYLKKRVCR